MAEGRRDDKVISRISTIGPTAFQYTSLYSRISEAKDLPKKEVTGVRDVFCDLRVDNEAVARTASVFNSSEPFWGEEYSLHVPLEYQHVSVYVYDHDNLGVKVPIGKVMLDREKIMSSPRGIDKWFPLKQIVKDEEIQGELLVEIMIDEYGEEFDRGVITLVEARDLASKDGKVDPFAAICYGGKDISTPVVRKTRFPRWNKTYEIPIKRPIADPDNRTLKISIYNGEKFHNQRFLGEVVIDLAELLLGQRYKTWYILKQQGESSRRDSKKEKDLGALRLKVQCHEERILDSLLYTPFVQLLLRAVESPSSTGTPLLMMLEEVMTMDRNHFAHTLARFYIAYKAVIPLLDCLVIKEVEMTVRTENMFRGNSLASKCFDHFMKVAALPYLHEILKPLIDMIFADKKYVELDIEQAKMSKAGKSGSASKIVESSISQLSLYIKMATDAIFSSVERCPIILRQALKMLWKRVSAKFPDDDVPYMAVTGFIFLRFFVPAILSPKLFALREEHADQRTERTLKLTAKVLQSIANLRTEVEAKELFLSPMAPIMREGVTQLREFVNKIVAVDETSSQNSRALSPGLLTPDPFSMGYLQHVVLAAGELWKRHTSGAAGVGSLLYRRRYFELTNIALTYFPTDKKTGEAKSFPVQWIKVVEKVDEGAFGRKYMFQVVIIHSGPSLLGQSSQTTLFLQSSQTTLYLQASDVNEQNKWVSAIRKACLCNRDMSPVHHPGYYQPRKKEWSCCRALAIQEPGCCPCHRGVTIGDWRDPLDPHLDAQVIYSQYQLGRDTLCSKYMSETPNTDSNDGANNPSQINNENMRIACRELLTVLNELAYHHTQVQGL